MFSTFLFGLSLLAHAQTPETTSVDAWEATLDRATKGIVALNVTGTRDFDTESARSSRGTGFVVDAKRGIVLTNRHMVHAGPVIAEAVFLDHEEVELHAIYRDPVHDFGFYRFNPDDLKYKLVELPLDPSIAKVGMEIRVVGNDAGEKLSILDGTLARLDRKAPNYGRNTYNDFNTFYIQAASGTSGGSSGSPVLDIEGRVVALNAGGSRDAASSFYLPLDRVVRAFELIQQGKAVSRGTLQTTLVYTPYDEVKRLGVPDDVQAVHREAFPKATGMLVVRSVGAEGPADGKLEPGDVLTKLEGAGINTFLVLEALLDDSVGKAVALEVHRGGELLAVELTVNDLHAITPDAYVEVGRAVFNDLSYHQARNHTLPVKGVYVAVPGYMFRRGGVPDNAVITSIDGEAVEDLLGFERIVSSKPHGHRMEVRYFTVGEPRRQKVAVIEVDRVWYSMRRCVRDDTTGDWPCVDSPAPPAPPPVQKTTPLYLDGGSRAAKTLARSLVMVDFDIPHPTAGVKDFNYVGTGLVIDAEQGLVLVDRDTVPVTLGDAILTFGGTVRVPAQLRYQHPVHNFAVLSYDPAAIGATEVKTAELLVTDLEEGDRIWQVGLNSRFQTVDVKTEIEDYNTVSFNPSSTPRYRDANMQAVELTKSEPSMGGVLADRRGRVVAMWASFIDQREGERGFWGMPMHYVVPAIEALRAGEEPTWHWLGAELLPETLASARDRGLSEERAQELFDHDPENRQILQVIRLTGGSDAKEKLQEGDLLVSVGDEVVTRVGELELLLKPWENLNSTLTVLRNGEELTVDIESIPLQGSGVNRVASWAGLLVHEPHFEISAQQSIEPEGVYIAWLWYGTPAARYGLRPTRRIVEVNNKKVVDLDGFLAAVDGFEDRSSVRLKMVALDGRVSVHTLKLDLKYWPTVVFDRADGAWTRSEY